MIAPEQFNGCMAFMVVNAPVPGQVKSRLATVLGNERAAETYRKLVRGTVTALRDSGIPLRVLYHPVGSERSVLEMVGSGTVLRPQRGADLNERLLNGFLELFEEGFDKVAAISSDVPELTGNVLAEAFGSLSGNDAVLGACTNGGYYLIGFRTLTFRPESLTGVEMGTDRTASETLRALQGLKVHILPTLSNIDAMEA